MAGRRTGMTDILEIVRWLRQGRSIREIQRNLGAHRKTIRGYQKLALKEGWLDGKEDPSLKQIQEALTQRLSAPPSGPSSSLEKYRDIVVKLRSDKVEMQAILQILTEQHGYDGSYSSVRRFIRRLEPVVPTGFMRIETPPGEEAQVDFGYIGKVFDPITGKIRKTWVFVMTLSHSRHQYAEAVFDQTIPTWLECHIRAFEFFQGIPQRIVIDNLKAAITKACFNEPKVQRSYQELAGHYGFLIAPCRVATPRHKGKVESGVHYVQRNALAGRTFRDIHELNEHLRTWILTTAGMRKHGTTQQVPLSVFENAEKQALRPLPRDRYEPAEHKEAKLHPDCHIVFAKAYYSAPFRLIGQKLLVRATARRVEIYHQHERVATHPRAKEPGERMTIADHYPPQKLAGVMRTPVQLREAAERIGRATYSLISGMLEEKPVDRIRSAQGIITLGKKYGPKRLENACLRAIMCGETSTRCVRLILKNGLENHPLPPEVTNPGTVPKQAAFARPVHELAAGIS